METDFFLELTTLLLVLEPGAAVVTVFDGTQGAS